MKKSRIKSLCAAVLAMTLGFSVLTGCGSGAGSSASANAITYNLNSDPKTLDPALNQAVDSSIVMANLFVGLCKLDENDKAIPGVAESWDISEDGLKYTFHLRDSKWSNGDSVTAQDFEYAWKRVLNPATAAAYALAPAEFTASEAWQKALQQPSGALAQAMAAVADHSQRPAKNTSRPRARPNLGGCGQLSSVGAVERQGC